jgi:DNA ligase D-like protein (predicted ligase)
MNRIPRKLREQCSKQKAPGFVALMKAVLSDQAFDDDGWLFERKLDGVRCLAINNGKKTTLYSRNRKRLNRTYPEIVTAVEALPGRFAVDCELVTFHKGLTSFAKLQRRMQEKDPDEKLRRAVPVHAYVFDIIHLDGYNTEQLPLRERKKLLKAAFRFQTPLHYLPHRNAAGKKYHREACKKGWEGVIAKAAHSPYQRKRSRQWLKLKCTNGQELIICGYTEPEGKRTGFGALLLGYYDSDKLCYAGRVGTGFDEDLLTRLHRRMAQMKRRSCPFDDFEGSEKDVTWVTPKLVAEIGFTEWTRDGKLRHPRFLGLREDKAPEDVVKEEP